MKILILPIITFLSMWTLVTISLKLSVTEVTYDLDLTYFIVFITSFVVFIFGIFLASIFPRLKQNSIIYSSVEISINSLKNTNNQKVLIKTFYYVFGSVLLLVILNLLSFGLPPFFGFLGFNTIPYLEYGRFLGFLIPLAGVMIVLSPFFIKKKYKYFSFLFGITILVLYVNRGPLMFYLFQLLLVKLIVDYYLAKRKTSYFLKKSFIILGFTLFMIYLMALIGEYRSGLSSFKIFLRITDDAFDYYNIGILWFLTYFSIPASNFFHYFNLLNFNEIQSVSFFSNILPAFLKIDSSVYIPIKRLNTTIDGVHFYMYNWYAELGLLGLISVNLLYGFMVYFFRKNILLYVISISVLFFAFFIDYLIYFPTIVELSVFLYISYKIRRN